MHGSSFYELPLPLRWFSANIGVHHVHHLSSGIPFYRLPEVLRTTSRAGGRLAGSISGTASPACASALWDEDGQRMVSFAMRGKHCERPDESGFMRRRWQWRKSGGIPVGCRGPVHGPRCEMQPMIASDATAHAPPCRLDHP